MLRVIRPDTGEEREACFDPGAHWDTTIQIYSEIVIFPAGNTSISCDGDAAAAGACLHAKKSVRVSECFPMKIALDQCDFRIFHSLKYLR